MYLRQAGVDSARNQRERQRRRTRIQEDRHLLSINGVPKYDLELYSIRDRRPSASDQNDSR